MARLKYGVPVSNKEALYLNHEDGKPIVPTLNTRSKIPQTAKQEQFLQDTTLINAFLAPVKSFLKIGYGLEAKGGKKNYYNVAVPEIRTTALQGNYPYRNIDPSKIMLTKGVLDSPLNATVRLEENGLIFTWDTAPTSKIAHYSDQVMTLAYFPEQGTARYMLAGAQRNMGKDVLQLNGIEKGQVAEIYIAFHADDHGQMSNSVYLGKIIS